MSAVTSVRSAIRGPAIRLTLLAFAVLLIIVNCIVALISVNQVSKTNDQMARSLRAIAVLKNIEDVVEDSSREQRAYRVFGDQHELEAYQQARARLPAALQHLRSILQATQRNSADVDHLALLVEQDTAALAASTTRITPLPSEWPPELAASVARAHGIVVAVDQFIENENGLLDQRLATIESHNRIILATTAFAAATSIVLIGAIFALMRRDLRRSEQRAEQHYDALRESEQRFHRIFDESPLGILLADPDMRHIVQVNPAFCHMLGFDAAQIVGRTFADLMHIDDREMLRSASRNGGGPDLDVEARFVTGSGVITWARVRLTHLSALDGRPGLLLALTEDITREKRAEAELRQAQKMEAIGQLTGGIAHDFNNLLGIIIGNAEFLTDMSSDADQGALAREILNSALSGADLTRRLLAFARRQPLQPRRIDLNAYLPNHVTILRRLLGESITLATSLANDLWPIRADPSQVGDALLNLAINARDAMPHGGTIRIETHNVHVVAGDLVAEARLGDYVLLAVTDSGIGMSPEVLERAVEPFFSTKAPRAGSGLGLSMIFGFANQSGGHLRIDSEPGCGTTVRLYLPRAEGNDAYEADEAADTPLPRGHEAILLVDDNAEMRAVARRHLVTLGYHVSEADSGPVALERLLAGTTFDLLLTDIVMPDGMTGYQLAAAARQLRPRMKVLFTTGYSQPDSGEQAASAGSATIRKPYRRQELAAMVRAALEA